MKSFEELSKEFNAGLIDTYKTSGLDLLCKELSKRLCEKKDELLTAWFAQYGFAPGKAVLVEDRSNLINGVFKCYIRQATEEEERAAIKFIDISKKQSAPCPHTCWHTCSHIFKHCPECGEPLQRKNGER